MGTIDLGFHNRSYCDRLFLFSVDLFCIKLICVCVVFAFLWCSVSFLFHFQCGSNQPMLIFSMPFYEIEVIAMLCYEEYDDDVCVFARTGLERRGHRKTPHRSHPGTVVLWKKLRARIANENSGPMCSNILMLLYVNAIPSLRLELHSINSLSRFVKHARSSCFFFVCCWNLYCLDFLFRCCVVSLDSLRLFFHSILAFLKLQTSKWHARHYTHSNSLETHTTKNKYTAYK